MLQAVSLNVIQGCKVRLFIQFDPGDGALFMLAAEQDT
jgi:hypothetical protein